MTSPWLTTREVAERLKFMKRDGSFDARAALLWIDEQKLPTKFRGFHNRTVLVHVDDVDAALVTRTAGESRLHAKGA